MIEIHTIETTSLGDRSYLVDDGTVALVADGVGRNLQDHLVLKVNYNCT